MITSKPKFAFVLSTSGALMQRALDTITVRDVTHLVIGQHEGPMLEKARSFGIPAKVIDTNSNEEFCSRVLDQIYQHEIDYVLSFYTKFFSATMRAAMPDKIINFHPSLLPAFKGMDGFGDGLAYHPKIIGTTVELIKEVMDEGKIVMQTACVNDTRVSREEMRDRIFVQQCKTLIQVVDWIVQGRMAVDRDKVTIRNAQFRDPEFSPALENPEALALKSTLFSVPRAPVSA